MPDDCKLRAHKFLSTLINAHYRKSLRRDLIAKVIAKVTDITLFCEAALPVIDIKKFKKHFLPMLLKASIPPNRLERLILLAQNCSEEIMSSLAGKSNKTFIQSTDQQQNRVD
jgi:hypothetical protein